MPEITEYKTGDKIKCKRTFDNMGIRYQKNEECSIFDLYGNKEDICEIKFSDALIVTMDKKYLKNFNKI